MNSLNDLGPIYYPSECDIEKDLFLPVMSVCSSFDCMTGYFSSGSLEELAEPIASYLKNPDTAKLRFIIGPDISSQDYDAILLAIKSEKNLIPLMFGNFELSEDSLRNNCLRAMAFLIASERLEIKFAIKYGGGIFHPKAWNFTTPLGGIAIHGSGNSTKGGLLRNFEQLICTRSWVNEENLEIYESISNKFQQFWDGKYPGIPTFGLSEDSLKYIRKISDSMIVKDVSDKEKIQELIDKLLVKKTKMPCLTVPDWLKYDDGDFAHQGEAIRAWVNSNYNGILTIATGGGKTLTSLVGSALLSQAEPLFITIAVPTKILIHQWADDVRKFGLEPINSSGMSKPALRREIKSGLRKIRLKQVQCCVLLISHDRLKSDLFDRQSMSSVSNLLIADEMHNLGSIGFQKNHPEFFKYKLGLSATPVRQFDDLGTNFLLTYFGGVIFEFPLEKAIGVCLVPFKYFAHTVMLTAEEEEDCAELTHKIKRLSYAAEYDANHSARKQLDSLRLARRRLIETASRKINKLDEILPENKNKLLKTIIFCTDKDPAQIEKVHHLLAKRSVNYHQITQTETSDQKLLQKVIDNFTSGSMDVLTSKKVLNEGFNVPSVQTAFLLSSSTVHKTWIQRLGRILRKSNETGKTHAELHDFIVLPALKADGFDVDMHGIVKSEYSRLKFFSALSMNGLEPGGTTGKMAEILELLEKT